MPVRRLTADFRVDIVVALQELHPDAGLTVESRVDEAFERDRPLRLTGEAAVIRQPSKSTSSERLAMKRAESPRPNRVECMISCFLWGVVNPEGCPNFWSCLAIRASSINHPSTVPLIESAGARPQGSK